MISGVVFLYYGGEEEIDWGSLEEGLERKVGQNKLKVEQNKPRIEQRRPK